MSMSKQAASSSGGSSLPRAACRACVSECEKFIAVLPRGYGCVVFTGAASIALNFWMAYQVVKARKQYNVEYPLLYSPENNFKNTFNCVQRAHQNYLESYPQFLFLLIAGGLAHPHLASAAGFVYMAGRVVYFRGYATGDPQKRRAGGWFHLGELALMLCTMSFSLRCAYQHGGPIGNALHSICGAFCGGKK